MRQVAERRFAAVALPVRVRGEADAGVERQIGRGANHALRIQGQVILEPQQSVDDDEAQKIDREGRVRVVLPRHLGGRVDAAHPIDQPLERTEDFVQAARLALVHAGHERAQGLDEGHEHDDVQDHLQNCVGSHANHSGFKSAITR